MESKIIPNTNMRESIGEVERFLNKLTGLNRFQSAEERALKMSLRI